VRNNVIYIGRSRGQTLNGGIEKNNYLSTKKRILLLRRKRICPNSISLTGGFRDE